MMKFSQAATIALIGLTLACADRGETAEAGVPADAPVLNHPRLELAETRTTVGAANSTAPALYGVMNVVEHRDGRFFVLNVGDGRIASYDSTGAYVSDVGRKGGGPGEFQVPVDIAMDGDELVVVDPQSSRVTRFNTDDLSHASSTSLDMRQGVAMELECCGPAGSILLGLEPIPGMTEDSTPRVAMLHEGGAPAVETVKVLDGGVDPIPVSYVTDGSRVTKFVDPPFAPAASWAAAPNGRLVWGDGSEYVVWQMGPDGSPDTAVADADADAIPVTEEDRARFLEFLPEEVDPATLELVFPETRPYFTAIRISGDGSLWLKTEAASSGERWDIWHDGQRLGDLRLPVRWRLVGLGPASIFVVEVSELEEETLHRIPLVATRGTRPE